MKTFRGALMEFYLSRKDIVASELATQLSGSGCHGVISRYMSLHRPLEKKMRKKKKKGTNSFPRAMCALGEGEGQRASR